LPDPTQPAGQAPEPGQTLSSDQAQLARLLTRWSDPAAIEAESMRIIESEVTEHRPFQGVEWLVVRRMIHTTADFELPSLARFHPAAVDAGLTALAAGCRIVTDTEMARMGIPLRRMAPLGCTVTCLMNDPAVAARAAADGVTRALAAVDAALDLPNGGLDGAVCVVGNAPTALLRLLEHIGAGRARPALVVGMPVGFVNAAESKDLLLAQDKVPYIAIQGRKGGSALAACVVNALAEVVLARRLGRALPSPDPSCQGA
jgi:precorrin-8X/cobalt-precorrin-8 methylmutase